MVTGPDYAQDCFQRGSSQKKRWYGSIRILTDGRVRFSSEPGRRVPTIRFSVQRHTCELDGRWVYDFRYSASRHVETAWQCCSCSAEGAACGRLALAMFLTLTLSKAVPDLLKFRSGVERWLAPALERTRQSLTKLGSNPALLKAIPAVLRSLEGIPQGRPSGPDSGQGKAPSRRATPDRKAKRGEQTRKR